MNREVTPWEGRREPLRRPRRFLAYAPTVGDKVRVRLDSKIYTVTGVSHLGAGIALTLEHETLITKIKTTLHTNLNNVEEVISSAL